MYFSGYKNNSQLLHSGKSLNAWIHPAYHCKQIANMWSLRLKSCLDAKVLGPHPGEGRHILPRLNTGWLSCRTNQCALVNDITIRLFHIIQPKCNRQVIKHQPSAGLRQSFAAVGREQIDQSSIESWLWRLLPAAILSGNQPAISARFPGLSSDHSS